MENCKESTFVRIVYYVVGILVLALGIVTVVEAGLGALPISTYGKAISAILNISFGCAICISYSSYVLGQILILGKDFKWINLLQILLSFVFGYCVDIMEFLWSFCPLPDGYIFQILTCFVGIFLTALGLHLYLHSGYMRFPAEGMFTAMAQKWKLPSHRAKIIFDSSNVIISAALTLIFLGKIINIREGTLIAAVGVGLCMKWIKMTVELFKKRKAMA